MVNSLKKSISDYQAEKPSFVLVSKPLPGNISTGVNPQKITITIYDQTHVTLTLPERNSNGVFKFTTVLQAINFLEDNFDLYQLKQI